MTLVQDGSIAGGVPTNTFGWCFRPGDIPAGHAPLLSSRRCHLGLFARAADLLARRLAQMGGVRADGAGEPAEFSGHGYDLGWRGRNVAGSFEPEPHRGLQSGLQINAKTPSPAIPNNARSADLFAALADDGNNFYAVKDMDGAAGARWTDQDQVHESRRQH